MLQNVRNLFIYSIIYLVNVEFLLTPDTELGPEYYGELIPALRYLTVLENR